MGKKKTKIQIIKIFLFIILYAFILNYITNIFYNKADAANFRPFYDMEEKFDVLFLGTSVMTSGISPLDLWNDYGIVSFNLANNGQSLPANYWALKSALKTQNPKVVVIDASYVFKEKLGVGSDENRIHQLIDNMPWSKEKMNAILELATSENRKNYIMSILYYHERWKELGKRDFGKITSINRGGDIAETSKGSDGEIFDTSVFSETLTILPKEEILEIPELSLIYLNKIIDLCKKNEIKVILLNFPSYAQGERNHGDGHTLQKIWNSLDVLADEWEVEYVNTLHMLEEIDFDLVEDLRDWRHIDVSGNQKMTSWLGKKLASQYQIPDRRNEEALQYWNRDYEEFCQYREKLLEEAYK